MTQICLKCRSLVAEDKRFCGNCGSPLTSVQSAISESLQELDASPGDDAALDRLTWLRGEFPESITDTVVADRVLAWCEARSEAAGGSNDRRRVMERWFEALVPSSDEGHVNRAVRVFGRLHGENDPDLVRDAAQFDRQMFANATASPDGGWVAALKDSARAKRKEGAQEQALTLLTMALRHAPNDSELLADVGLIRKDRRGRALRMLAWTSALLVAAAGAVVAYWFSRTAEVAFDLPPDVGGSVQPTSGPYFDVNGSRPETLRRRLPAGTYHVMLYGRGGVAWDTTFTARGWQSLRFSPLSNRAAVEWTLRASVPASVSVDGAAWLDLPVRESMQPGPHLLQFRGTHAEQYAESVFVVAGRDSVMEVALRPSLTGQWRRVDSRGHHSAWVIQQEGARIIGHIERPEPGVLETIEGDLSRTGAVHLESHVLDNGAPGYFNGSFSGDVRSDGGRIDGSFEITAHNAGAWTLERAVGASPVADRSAPPGEGPARPRAESSAGGPVASSEAPVAVSAPESVQPRVLNPAEAVPGRWYFDQPPSNSEANFEFFRGAYIEFDPVTEQNVTGALVLPVLGKRATIEGTLNGTSLEMSGWFPHDLRAWTGGGIRVWHGSFDFAAQSVSGTAEQSFDRWTLRYWSAHKR
jgi:hypothetical protein